MAVGGIPQKIVIDDTSSRIRYGTNWGATHGGGGDPESGPTFLNTLHETQGSGIFEFSFQFNGTAVEVIGTSPPAVNTTFAWGCYIAEGPTAPVSVAPPSKNNWSLCALSGLEDKENEIIVEVHVASSDSPFKLDYILYVPSTNVSLDMATIKVDNSDPGFQFDDKDNWFPVLVDTSDLSQGSSISGAKVTFDFVGQSLSWYGYKLLIPGPSRVAASATFAIDGGPPTTFVIDGPEGNSPGDSNQVFFTTPTLEFKQHILEVIYNGNNTQTPLSLAYVVIANTTIASPLTSLTWPSSSFVPTSSPSSPGGLPTNDPPSPKETPTNDIVGATVGGFAALSLVIFVTLLWWRRKRNSHINPQAAYPFTPGLPDVTASTNSRSGFSPFLLQTTATVGEGVPSYVKSATHPPGVAGGTPQTLTLPARVKPVTQPAGAASGAPQAPTLPVRDTQQPVILNRHQDSGIRLSSPLVQDIPPEYTAT